MFAPASAPASQRSFGEYSVQQSLNPGGSIRDVDDGGEAGPYLMGGGGATSAPAASPLIQEPVKRPAKFGHAMLEQLWPHYFTMSLAACFGGAIVSGVHLAQDPTVGYWVGHSGYAPAFIPVFLAVCHAVHLKLGRARLIPIIVSTCVPAVVLFFVGNFHFAATGIMADMLISRDCTTYSAKQDLHKAWVVAANLYETCVNRTTAEQGMPYEQGLETYRLQECKEYYPAYYVDGDPYQEFRGKWEYLRQLEETSYCSGWCWQTRPIWSFAEVRDPCCVAAGTTLTNKVKPLAARMMVTSVVIILGSVAAVVYIGNEFKKEGFEWERI